jgi:GNAT superfamily N-acetyltransferase
LRTQCRAKQPSKPRLLELETLSVRPGARGSGVGELLFKRVGLEAKDRGLSHINGSVIASNEAALRFYEREGAFRTYVCMRVDVVGWTAEAPTLSDRK